MGPLLAGALVGALAAAAPAKDPAATNICQAAPVARLQLAQFVLTPMANVLLGNPKSGAVVCAAGKLDFSQACSSALLAVLF